ncbi:zf-HC2 domain-containing protein [Geodermatophilus sp. DSM 44513]|uniref:anti-sigma factor family protein n=1 Tax=Geodermatophilus sp. DSM 44513 TaxID=1528104 RepID=UPI001413304C|nr:zf-HC2 domain-containing protein [Geodermatophilus sp. DSM 44513]WNV74397.1 zf-HC2 domain-containing protein [Geodermatophilus sp. DSM 44513]
MTDQGEHRRVREQLGWYALGHGTPEERAGVRAHLDGCAACRAELAELAPLPAWLARVDPDRLDEQQPAPPAGLGDAVLARIAAESAAVRNRPSRRVLAAAAAVGVAAAGFGVGWLVRPVPPQPPLEPVAVEVATTDIQATANVIPHTWGVEVRLVGEGFTAGAVYEVVVTDEDGTAVPAGQFLGIGPGELSCNLNSSVLREDATGFEVLAADGTVVASSQL